MSIKNLYSIDTPYTTTVRLVYMEPQKTLVPPELTQVTPVSKYLALSLFIILPFVGFFLGMEYGRTASLQEMVEPSISRGIPPTAPGMSDPTNPDGMVSGTQGGGEDSFDSSYQNGTDAFSPIISDAECMITNCHGTEVTCGPFSEEGLMCTMEYMLGDFCRGLVQCVSVDGICTPQKDPAHAECVSCVEECSADDDPMSAFECEAQCRTSLGL